MDVKVMSQGGQNTLDYTSKNQSVSENVNTSNGGNGQNVVQPVSGDESNKVDESKVKKAVEKVNKLLDESSTHVEYEVHEKFKDIIVKIVDNDTKQVIQELPPKKLLDMVAKLCEMAGLLVDKKA